MVCRSSGRPVRLLGVGLRERPLVWGHIAQTTVTGSISGRVLIEGSGASGVRVALSNGSSATTSTGGSYSFLSIPNGSYTVSISSLPSDATCPTTSRSATVSASNPQVTVDFDCEFVRTASILGSVTVEGTGLSGVTVGLGGTASASTSTDSDGQFAFTSLRAGSYTLSLSGFDASRYTFAPTFQSVTLSVGETAFIDFSGVVGSGVVGPTTVSAGGYHSCALISGSAFCWGRGVEGQLGAGAFGILALTPVASASGLVFEGLDAGFGYTCGVTAVGDAYCWGFNSGGQLGDGSTSDSSVPVLVSGGLAFISVSAGVLHTCGVTAVGDAYCWGSNGSGQLNDEGQWADGSTSSSSVPVLVSGGLAFASVSAGSSHTCGVIAGGAAYCWGSNGNGMLGDGSFADSLVPVLVSGGLAFASVSAGSNYTCGVTASGAAYCWGASDDGQRGDGSTSSSSVPVRVSGGLTFASVSSGVGGVVSFGSSHTCGVTSGGDAYCWGSNGGGRLGDASTSASSVPVLVSGGLAFASVSAGASHTCGVTTGGDRYCWGFEGFGQLGGGHRAYWNTPQVVLDLPAAGVVRAGTTHSCSLSTGGDGYCWGSNFAGELGDGSFVESLLPVPVSGGLAFTSVSPGSVFTCGAIAGGDAYCWGWNRSGLLGDESTSVVSSVPVPVSGDLGFASVSAGGRHVCGVTAGGAAYCWGANGSGQLGDGSTFDSSVPVLVSGGLGFASVSAGSSHTCGWTRGVIAGGLAYCWGANGDGQLGDGSTADSSVPVLVSGGLTYASVSAGTSHTCGATAVGDAYCWGRNGSGELGDGSTADNSVPVRVSGGLTFASVSAGTSHTCGVAADGAAYCWGFNFHGQLGDASWVDSSVPVQVSGGITFRSVDAGDFFHTCGVALTGTGYCWGSNSNGKLGNGMSWFQPVPMPVAPPSLGVAGFTRPPNHEPRSRLWELREWEDKRFRASRPL